MFTHVYTKEYWCVKQVKIGICLFSSSDKGMLAIDIDIILKMYMKYPAILCYSKIHYILYHTLRGLFSNVHIIYNV